VLGTPHDSNWPDALKLSDFKPTFPKFRGIPLQEHTNDLSEIELDLLKGLVALDPARRISAKMALLHPYFDSLDKATLPYKYEEIMY
jgi:serine/threonine protein kinase